MNSNEEEVCSIGPSYLILRTEKPGISARHMIPQQDVLFYSTDKSDEMFLVAKSIPQVPSAYNLKQVRINSSLWLLQPIESPANSQEWLQKLNYIFRLCIANDIDRIFVAQPSNILCDCFATIGVSAIVTGLEQLQGEAAVRVTLILRPELCKQVRKTLEQVGLCNPMIGELVLSERALLEKVSAALRCNRCRRLAYSPKIADNSETIMCKQCMSEQGLSEGWATSEMGFVARLIAEVKVTCRCGAEAQGNTLDRHAVECRDKEIYCSEHKVTLRGERFFDHLLQAHQEFVRQKAPIYLNRD